MLNNSAALGSDSFELSGLLDVNHNGYGFVRAENPADDAFVPAAVIAALHLRPGDIITGPTAVTEQGNRLLHVDAVNGHDPDEMRGRPEFAKLTPVYPDCRIDLECLGSGAAGRYLNIMAPVGFGQRGIIAAPPKAGKTTMLTQIARGIAVNNPDVQLITLLIDERPEEATMMKRELSGTVCVSPWGADPADHIRLASVMLEHAKRQVEFGRDVVILLDSLTRLARACNLISPPSGRTLSGGLDPASLLFPRQLLGAARNIEQGGSLTIIATALVETGSQLDEIIYEEMKGTANWDVRLDRRLAERRIYPAIDLDQTGTRRDDLLLNEREARLAAAIRRSAAGEHAEGGSALVSKLFSKYKSSASLYEHCLRQAR